MWYILKHPSTDNIKYTEDRAVAERLVSDGHNLVTTSQLKPEEVK